MVVIREPATKIGQCKLGETRSHPTSHDVECREPFREY